MSESAVHFIKACSPIDVSPSGRVTSHSFGQPYTACLGSVFIVLPKDIFFISSILANTLSGKRQIKGRVDRYEKIVVERIEMFHHY